MLKWLTRNDGGRIDVARRRIQSPRGSVFSEFALVMPIVVLACSAMLELAGFWDAQVMANHAAWQVGRIVMVRGSDGLEFSTSLSKKSKTGIKGSKMPEMLKKMLGGLDTVIQGANKFNNRANIATMYLMSTCGMGYYGASPGKTLSDGFTLLCKSVVDTLTKDIPKWIKEGVTSRLPKVAKSGEGGIGGFVNGLVSKIVDKITESALKPIADGIQKRMQSAFDSMLGKNGSKIDNLFSGNGAFARHSRQMYGAASRIVRAKKISGREVVTVTDMTELKDGFMFAKNSNLGRLVYPQVYDKEGKQDGYFVTGAHGWPANDGGHAMVHVEINWPYERGWLFPVVSGGGASTNAPTATGHSMVFPQPDIQNEHLYSEGATAFEEGSYTNNVAMAALDDLAKDMKNYLKFVKFGMKYRILKDSISLADERGFWASASWKKCPELKELFGIGEGEGKGDYAKCWSAITGGKDQDAFERDLKAYFKESSYHNRDYFHWEGSYHKRYMPKLVMDNGNSKLGAWFADKKNNALTSADAKTNMFPINGANVSIVSERINAHSALIAKAFPAGGFDATVALTRIMDFAKINSVNVHNMVKWTEGADLEDWKKKDAELAKAAAKADKMFGEIKKLIEKEIHDIENIENGNAAWTGDESDPVYDATDEEAVKDPESMAKKAREKWKTMKENLKKKLAEVDNAVVALRKEWETYKNAAADFTRGRELSVSRFYVDSCIKLMAKRKSVNVLRGDAGSFKFPKSCIGYDIVKETKTMLSRVETYRKKADEAYKKEVEYGTLLGLESAGRAKKDGKTIDQIVDEAEGIEEDKPGSLAPGSDSGAIIDKDRQSYSGGVWKWK